MKKLITVLLIIGFVFTSYYVGKRYYKYYQFKAYMQSYKDNLSLGFHVYRTQHKYFVKTKNAPFNKKAYRDSMLKADDYLPYASGLKEYLMNENIDYLDTKDSLAEYFIINPDYEYGKVDTHFNFFDFLFITENIRVYSSPKPDSLDLMDKETRRRERYKEMHGYYPEQVPKDFGTVEEEE